MEHGLFFDFDKAFTKRRKGQEDSEIESINKKFQAYGYEVYFFRNDDLEDVQKPNEDDEEDETKFDESLLNFKS